MNFWEILLLVLLGVSVLGLITGYVFYPILLYVLLPKRSLTKASKITVSATLIIPAWEEEALGEKIENTKSLHIDGIELQVIVITDRSEPVGLPPNFRWIQETERKGKSASINRAMQSVHTPLVIFSDANTCIQSGGLIHLLTPFQDPRIGAVAGEKQIRAVLSNAAGEQMYWKYESALKRLDESLHSVISGAGELFAIRTALFEELPTDTVLDDLELSWQVIQKGHRIAYAPDAIATEAPSKNLKEEAKRKVRMAAGSYQFLSRHALSDFFRVSRVFGWQFTFRKWFRWVLAPVFLMIIFFSSIGLLLVNSRSDLSIQLLYLEALFFTVALLGWVLLVFRIRIGWLTAPFYFLFMHSCQVRGWIRYCFGKQPVTWEKSERSSLT